METALIVAIVAGAVAIVSAVFTGLNARGIEEMKAKLAAEREADDRATQVAIYSAPLAQAAFDLQSRLYNFLRQDLAGVYLKRGDVRTRSYVVEKTAFLIAQFFCWSELTRQEIHFIEMPSPGETRELLRLQDRFHSEWGTDRYPPAFRIFAGEQRAVGEALIVGQAEFTTCMGYGAFLQTFPSGKNQFIDALRADVESLETDLNTARPRLTQIQHTLIDILALMDPDGLRFASDSRSKA